MKDNAGTANGGVDTSAPQTFHITVNIPPVVTIISPTNGAVFIAPANFAVAADAQDPDGTVVNVEFFESTNKFDETAIGNPFVVLRSNVAAGTYTFTAKATDDDGASAVSAPVTITVLESLPLTILQGIHFNPQTGLYEQTVRVSNPSYSTFDGVRVNILGLPGTVHVYNASGETNGIPYVQSGAPVPPGGHVDFVIEYYVTAGGAVPNPVLQVELVSAGGGAAVFGAGVHINRGFMRPDRTFLVEFATDMNRLYYVQYSSDLRTWKTAQPAISGNGTWIQWIDSGLPKTESAPATTDMRFYRVIVLP